MADKVLEVLVPEATVPKAINEFDDGRGGVAYQQVGVPRFKGDKVSLDEVSPALIEMLEDSDHPNHESVSKKFKLTSGSEQENLAVRLGLPFDGYDEMDEEELLEAMRVLPSPTVEAIKTYERQHENRPKIVQYMTGFGVSPGDYEDDAPTVGSDVQDGAGEAKATSRLKTRRVTEDGVELGEGYTGSPGHPQIPYGSSEEEKSSTPKKRRRTTAKKSSGSKSSGSSSSGRRRSRRSRSSSSSSSGEGSGSSESGSSGSGE